ncbi:(2,3-dihydroxybenzoyl)adenylate synthase [Motilibacter deserti]|uniref:(2,3-dihydroxybenzoyl)adenylate synthase n=1 Tax=Motilibacter deserti TaxID=2714956 RepID=A0ABX0GU98_9ACTN|nr:(2,3-dihydroxybenzoyl)adenylate synthase [Motilibacter deserti]
MSTDTKSAKQQELPGYVPWPEEFVRRYREVGYWAGQTFGSMLRELAERYADRVAVVDGERRWTYSELDERADRLAAGLHRIGIRAQDRVVLQLPNVAEFFEVCFALWRVGALPVFALPAHRSSEITYFCSFTEAVAYIVPGHHAGFDYRALGYEAQGAAPSLRHVLVVGDDPGSFTSIDDLRDAPRPLADPAPSDVAFLQLSGGSTGVPKLIPRTHDDYLYSVRASAKICGLDPSSVYLAALPVAHNFPLSSPGVLGTLYAGGTVVLAPDPSPATALALIERERVTITALVPPLALLWLDSAARLEHDLSSLEVLQVGGSKLSEEVARRVRPTLGCGLQQVFGMAEGLVNYTRLHDPDDIILATQGRPISPDDEVRVVDDEDQDVPAGEVGHLLTRGPYTIRGYYRAEEHNRSAFTRDGFYRTGDLVRVTPEGYLVVTGRDKDQINRGGEKIAAEEIENHLLAHPAVHDAAVVAVPDAYLGERSCAVVVPRGEAPSAPALKKFLRERGLAAYKVPDLVKFVDAFAQTGVGKVSRKQLRESLAASLRP